MKKFIQEFKEFAFKGNVLDMAIGVIIGTAFGKIVTSLVDDIIMPLIAKLIKVNSMADWAPGGIAVGTFLQSIIDFLLVAIVLFLVLRVIMKASSKFKKEKEEESAGPTEIELLTEIRDSLKNK